MSSYDDMMKLNERLTNMYSPFIESIQQYSNILHNISSINVIADTLSAYTHVLPDSNGVIENMTKMVSSYSINLPEPSTYLVNMASQLQQLNMPIINYDQIMQYFKPTMELMQSFNFKGNIVKEILHDSKTNLHDLTEKVYAEANNEDFKQATPESEDDLEKDFKDEEELVEAINEHVQKPETFSERAYKWHQEKKEKFFIAICILGFLYSTFVQPYISENIGIPVMTRIVATVKEIPKSTGKIIDTIEKNINAIVIDDVPYYYKVSYTDENGEKKEGYVAKKNLIRGQNEVEP